MGYDRKSRSSNTIERDVNVVESFYRRYSSQGSDVNEDLSLRGSEYNSRELSSPAHAIAEHLDTLYPTPFCYSFAVNWLIYFIST